MSDDQPDFNRPAAKPGRAKVGAGPVPRPAAPKAYTWDNVTRRMALDELAKMLRGRREAFAGHPTLGAYGKSEAEQMDRLISLVEDLKGRVHQLPG